MGTELHHRWYEANAYTGFESDRSVMWVCHPCHQVIHGRTLSDIYIENGSLADVGDSGFDMSQYWRSFLNRSRFN